jgi:hypothetical protein
MPPPIFTTSPKVTTIFYNFEPGVFARRERLQPANHAHQLQQIFELLRCQTGVGRNAAHRKWVDGTVPRDCEADFPVRHNRVLAFAGNPKTNLFENANSVVMANPGKLRHRLNSDDLFLDTTDATFLGLDLQPLANGYFDIFDGFFARNALGMATGQGGAAHCPTFFRLNKPYAVVHAMIILHMARKLNSI